MHSRLSAQITLIARFPAIHARLDDVFNYGEQNAISEAGALAVPGNVHTVLMILYRRSELSKENNMTAQIFVNLPVKNLNNSVGFFNQSRLYIRPPVYGRNGDFA